MTTKVVIRSIAGLFCVILIGLIFVCLNALYRNSQIKSPYSWHVSNGPVDHLYSIAITPSGDIYAAGTHFSSCVYRSIDKGQTWVATSKGIASCYVNTIASDSDGVIYIGTGRGIYQSNDRGNSWKLTNGNLPVSSVTSLTVDLEHRIYAACNDGQERTNVYASDDKARHWRRIWEAQQPRIGVQSIVRTKKSLFIGTGHGGLFRSRDNGQHWKNLTHKLKLKSKSPETACSIASIIVDRKNRIYVNASIAVYKNNSFNDHPRVFVSDDDGNSWQRIKIPARKAPICLAVGSDNTVFLGDSSCSIYASSDNAKSWQLSWRPRFIDSLLHDTINNCIADMAIDSSGRIFVTTNGYQLWGEYNRAH